MSNEENGQATIDATNQPTDASTAAPQKGDEAESADGGQQGGAQVELAAARDKYLRLAADFDNFRKRSRREADDAERRGRETLLREFLPVFDNLERALQVANQATDVRAVADGIGMVLRQFSDTLERASIRRVTTLGQPFDPTVHEAVQQIASSEHAPGTIVAEVQPGYASGDKLVRAALVVVAKSPSGT